MKKLVKSIHLELELIAVLNDALCESVYLTVVATKHDIKLEYRDLPIEWQLSDKVRSVYQNWIKSMASIIASYGFEIVDEYQSAESYSYYIQFSPIADLTDDIPDRVVLLQKDSDMLLDVKLRLSNHYLPDGAKVADSIERSRSTGKIFSEFVVEGVKYEDINAAIKDLQEICKDLTLGDYSRLHNNDIKTVPQLLIVIYNMGEWIWRGLFSHNLLL